MLFRKYKNKVIKLYIKRMYNKGNLFKLLKFLYYTTPMSEYIFHCKRKSCGAIVYKSDKPFLNLKKLYKCKRCAEEYTGAQLVASNKRNIRKYIKNVEDSLS